MTHTPGPWTAIQYDDTDGWRIEAPQMSTPGHAYNVAYMARRDCNQPAADNAAFIVRACNSHADLVRACEIAGQALDSLTETCGLMSAKEAAAREVLRYAIAKAREEKR